MHLTCQVFAHAPVNATKRLGILPRATDLLLNKPRGSISSRCGFHLDLPVFRSCPGAFASLTRYSHVAWATHRMAAIFTGMDHAPWNSHPRLVENVRRFPFVGVPVRATHGSPTDRNMRRCNGDTASNSFNFKTICFSKTSILVFAIFSPMKFAIGALIQRPVSCSDHLATCGPNTCVPYGAVQNFHIPARNFHLHRFWDVHQ